MTKLSEPLIALLLISGLLASPAAGARRYGLEELRAVALARHPTLESARAALEAAAAFERQQRLLDDPLARWEAARATSGPQSGDEWAIEVAQRLPVPGHRRWRVRLAEAGARRAGYDRQAVVARVELDVGRLWVEAILARRAAEVGERGEAISRQLLELVERRVEAGEAAPREALTARTEWFARRRLSLLTEQQVAGARAALDIYCDRALGGDFELAGELDSPRPLPSSDRLAAWLHDANPRLVSRRAAVEESEAARAIEQRGALPGVEISVARESELDKDSTGVGVELVLPLWNRNRPAADLAETEVSRRRGELGELTLELAVELERAVVDYRSAAEAIALFDGGWRQAAREAVEIATFSFDNGESSLLELLDAQRSALEVELAEAESRAQLTLARLRIEHLVGRTIDPMGGDGDD